MVSMGYNRNEETPRVNTYVTIRPQRRLIRPCRSLVGSGPWPRSWRRLELVLKARGWTPYEWSQKAVLSDSAVANIISRGGSARPASLAALAKAASVSYEWLSQGTGASGLDDHAQPPASDEVDAAGRRSVSSDASRTHRPLLENLPTGRRVLAGAKQIARDRGREVPEWAWGALAKSGGLLTGPLSAAAVFDLAKTYADHNIGKPQATPERETSGVARKAQGTKE